MEFKPEDWEIRTSRIGYTDRFVVEIKHIHSEHAVKCEASTQTEAYEKAVKIIKKYF